VRIFRLSDQSNNAAQLTIEESDICAYLQVNPAAAGPDKEMNARSRQAIYAHLAMRRHSEEVSPKVLRLKPQETELSDEQMKRLEHLMDEVGVPAAARREMIDDFGWEANLVPADAKDILVIGCGNGVELLFLSAVLPEAKITALDYRDELSPALKRATGVRLIVGNMNEILPGLGQEFDLISSNHTLEHLYKPTDTLTTLASVLRPKGALISTLPMDGMNSNPFMSDVKKVVERKKSHPLDVVYLDAGHPWKTNPADLTATLQEAGFESPVLYQREEHLSRVAKGGEQRLRRGMAIGKVLHTLTFRLSREILKIVFPKNPPRTISRVLLAAELRLWFGTNRLKNTFMQEVLVLARKRA
jgi:ubiquinone/menaquinone biosynthesis C-methylase UbiE